MIREGGKDGCAEPEDLHEITLCRRGLRKQEQQITDLDIVDFACSENGLAAKPAVRIFVRNVRIKSIEQELKLRERK